MTREEALQVVARDAVLNPFQAGTHLVRQIQGDEYEAFWTDRDGTVWRLSYDLTRLAWGMPPKEISK